MKKDVVLLNMPFAPVNCPSLALSLLKECLKRKNISAKVLYPNLDFMEKIGPHLYDRFAFGDNDWWSLGEWIFSCLLFPDKNPSDFVGCINPKVSSDIQEVGPETIPLVISEAEVFIEHCCDEILHFKPKVVGFTNTFRQHLASLALAKRIKALAPETKIVLGGANCEGIMGLENLRQFTFVDAVVSGPGEIVFPQLVQQILTDDQRPLPSGVYQRLPDGAAPPGLFPANAQAPNSLNDLPLVHFDDFFEKYEGPRENSTVLMETSRGCWWGQRRRCIFCSFSGGDIQFHSKSIDRIIAEYTHLAENYPRSKISIIDNMLNSSTLDLLIPHLAKHPKSAINFLETRATLRKDQIELLAQSRVERLIVGVESLDDQVLSLMNKGTLTIQNIQYLKWCKELGIKAIWNILYGTPGEPPQAYKRMTAIIPLLTHFEPCLAFTEVSLLRFSPMFEQADSLGVRHVRPAAYYGLLYPFSEEVLNNLAFIFQYDCDRSDELMKNIALVGQQVEEWRKVAHSSALFYLDEDEELTVYDSRPIAVHRLHHLRAMQRAVYFACDCALSLPAVCRAVGVGEDKTTNSMVLDALQQLVADKLMVEIGGRYLSLATRLRTCNQPPASVMVDFLTNKAAYRQDGGHRRPV